MALTTDRVALVTGAGRRRIGNLIARDLAQVGYRVLLHYNRSKRDAEETVEQIRAEGGVASCCQADLTDEGQVDKLFAWARQVGDRLDVLVNTVAIWPTQSLETVTKADLLRCFEVNTVSTFLCSQRAGLVMAGQPEGGAIINFGDAGAGQPILDRSAYLVSKGAIPTLTQALAVELASRNPRVRVNCIQPGSVMAPPDATEQDQQRRREATLVNDADRPTTVTHAVRFLIENEFMTGACLQLDGGRSLRR